MKKLLYSFLILSSATLFAQKNSATKFAVANDIVGTVDMFNDKKDIIQGTATYKTPASLPQNLKKFSSIAENGLTEFKIRKGTGTLDRVSLSEMNEYQNLPKNTPVFIDGYEFSDTDIKVYGDILAKVEVKEDSGKKFLSITTNLK